MTKEEKQLLLKDLCARLPYGVKIHVDYTFKPPYNVHLETDCGLVEFNVEKGEYLALTDMDNYSARKMFALENIKPYLRPISNMTAEEKQSYYKLINNLHFADGSFYSPDIKDWLDERFFDYRGLIPMGLALEAPKDMYKTE